MARCMAMEKTTLYLPAPLKRALEETARALGRSEADIVREALEIATRKQRPPRPRLPLFRSKEPTLAEHTDRALRGFGER